MEACSDPEGAGYSSCTVASYAHGLGSRGSMWTPCRAFVSVQTQSNNSDTLSAIDCSLHLPHCCLQYRHLCSGGMTHASPDRAYIAQLRTNFHAEVRESIQGNDRKRLCVVKCLWRTLQAIQSPYRFAQLQLLKRLVSCSPRPQCFEFTATDSLSRT